MRNSSEQILLRDGRRLSFIDLGDPAGWPTFFFHGTPGSKRFAERFREAARETGCRLIAPDRPGMGSSTWQPRRRLLDWPLDVKALADCLSISRFSVCGHSGGGPYALACASALPQRVQRCAVMSGAAPIALRNLPTTREEDRRTFRQFTRPRWQTRAMAAAGWLAARIAPSQLFAFLFSNLSDPDVQILREGFGDDEILAVLREGLAGLGRGATHDMCLFGEDWGFTLDDISIPVDIWHGQEDRTSPLVFASYLHSQLADSELHLVPNTGHAWPAEKFQTILLGLRPGDQTSHL